MDFEESLAHYATDLFVGFALQHVADARLVVFSDYAKGSLHAIESLMRHCREAGIATLVDPKGTDFERYRGATLLTPNLTELEAVVGPCADESVLVQKAEALRAELDIQAILVTRSEAGMSLIESGKPARHYAASAKEVFDVTGAGDTVIAVIAGCLSAGMPLGDAARFANQAAGVVVGKLGTASVSPAELNAAMENDFPREGLSGVMTEAELLTGISQARESGQRVVMTNGCFDLLHPGHIAYLEHAAALGDLLVVAVTDDDSVRRLKGDSRPINSVEDRMAVLAGLSAVSCVLTFSEDTPARLVDAVRPDVLVKGGDYQVEEIAGHDSVLANGGQVVTLDYLSGHSTSDIIGRMGDS